jgi:hypothetical protein
VKYFTSFLDKNSGYTSNRDPLKPPEPLGSPEEVTTQNSGHSYFHEPLEPLKPLPSNQKPSSSGSSGSKNQVCPEISVVRRIVAIWSIPLRERWGRRANELADAGVPHPDDEVQAFVELSDASPVELADAPPEETPAPCRPEEPRSERDMVLPFAG